MHKLCLVDRLAIGWALFLILSILALQEPGGFAVSMRPENFFDGGWLALLGKLVILPWGILRLLDLVCGGPQRRRYRMHI